MRKILVLSLLIFVLAALPLFAACPAETTPTPTVKTPTLPSTAPTATTAGNWWDELGEPQYGGEIVLRLPAIALGFDNITYFGTGQQFWLERLWTNSWTVDRDEWSFEIGFTPVDYMQGQLAESWELPDAQTVIFHIREGVTWQDKAPVNGREFTAYDVEYHYDRMLGTGSGFTEGSPYYVSFVTNIEGVTATDEYTVEFKFKEPSVLTILVLLDAFALNTFEARESVELEGGLSDWQKAVGTGPWMLTEYIEGTSVTYDRNPNYWGYDERYPENQLPYADNLKILAISDTSTAQAALKTGKITLLSDINWQQAGNIAETNPELEQAQFAGSCPTLELRCDTEPFTDFNVRKAMQLAINRTELAESYYGGVVDGKPSGLVNPKLTGYCFHYDDWPQELKDEYGFDPEKAKQMLADAGYPDGFETNIIGPTDRDAMLLQAMKAYLQEINIEMTIEMVDPTTFRSITSGGLQDQMIFSETSNPFPPNNTLWKRSSAPGSGNYTYNNDPVYDAMLADIETATSLDEMKELMVAADRYAIEHHWVITAVPTCTYNLWQPYLGGYSGESAGWWGSAALWARLWIKQ